MSAATATLIAGGLSILGTLLGTILGLLGERWMRSRGDVRCVLGGISHEALLEAPNGMTFSPPENLGELSAAGLNARGTLRVSWEVDLRFFNQKDEPTGLHALSLAFVDGEGNEALVGPLQTDVSGRTRQLRSPE